MRELTAILREATAAIPVSYFRLPIDGGPAVYRERVYCYELYHQMRLRWPNDAPYMLNGEVDKRAHPLLGDRGIRQQPDLLVHTPGAMAGNHAVIEIKHARTVPVGVRKDLETLTLFMEQAQYRRAIYLMYGAEGGGRVDQISRVHAQVRGTAIELWLHVEAGTPAIHVRTLQAL